MEAGVALKSINPGFILSTNICERVFSVAGYVVSPRQMSFLPLKFQEQILWHVNHIFWENDNVHQMV